MKNVQNFTDKTAIGLPLLCTLHCLTFPSIFILLPSAFALELNSKVFYLIVIPASAYTLTSCYKRHRKYRFPALVLVGLTFQIGGAVLVGPFLGETRGKIFATIDTAATTYKHFINYPLCQHGENCAYPRPSQEQPI